MPTPHLFWKPTAKGYMPSYFDSGNAILINLRTANYPWPDALFKAAILKMNPRFSRSVHWLFFLLCIASNAFAEITPTTLKNADKPVFVDIGRVQGHYERGIETIGGVELRGTVPPAVAAKPSFTPQDRNKPVASVPKLQVYKNRFVFSETGRVQGHHERGIVASMDAIGLRSDEPDGKLVFIDASRVEGNIEQGIEAIGDVELRSGDTYIVAKRLKYFHDTDEVTIEGKVNIEHGGDKLEGLGLRLNVAETTGQLSQLSYLLKNDGGRGGADLLKFEGAHNYRVQRGTYTTCPAGDNDWMLHAGDLEIDNKQKVGSARHVKLTFKDVPVMYTPWLNFSFDGERKSGLLAPLPGYNVRTGAELTVPFYWNIAPNVDATISARTMSKRGIMLTGEFRYLQKNASGNLLLETLPTELARSVPGSIPINQNRYYVELKHRQNLGNGWTGNVDYSKVSDSQYFMDLSADIMRTVRANLMQMGSLSYQRTLGTDGTLNFKAAATQFQSIRGGGAYSRLPEFTLAAMKPIAFGEVFGDKARAEINLNSSWTEFSHINRKLVAGSRFVLYPTVSIPFRKEFGHIIPVFGVHHTSYDLRNLNTQTAQNPERTLPIFSLDSGLIFERDVKVRGENFIQTLEPRAFYTYIPYRDQSHLPNFDSAFTDFSFAQIFKENRFSGSDRINDANRMALGVTSRLFEESSGKERLSFSLGQQIYFSPTRVAASNVQPANSKIDLIAAVTGNLAPTIKTDTTMQFNQSEMEVAVVRSALGYNPEVGKLINIGYRFSRYGPGANLNPLAPVQLLQPFGLHQADISTQWRFAEKWQGVGKINYSLLDSRVLESLAGIEYNACCWSLRFVFQQIAITPLKTTTAAFLQLELNGLMQVGNSPLNALIQRIPGYTDANPNARKRRGGP